RRGAPEPSGSGRNSPPSSCAASACTRPARLPATATTSSNEPGSLGSRSVRPTPEIPVGGIIVRGSDQSTGEHRDGRLRLPRQQAAAPQPAPPDRRTSTRPPADGRGRRLLHRHPHPDLRGNEGAPILCPVAPRGAPPPLRGQRPRQRRQRSRNEGPRSVRS